MSMSFRDLDVWKRSIALASEIYSVTKMLPPDEKIGLTAQMRRSAVSISCNIAEGYGRATRGEYMNHLSMARGSLNEVDTPCVICRELGLLSEESLGAATSEIARLPACQSARNSGFPASLRALVFLRLDKHIGCT